MNIILFDDNEVRLNLLPLTFTRPVADIRFGIITIREKWEMCLPGTYSYITADYLSKKFPAVPSGDSVYIAGHVTPSDELVSLVSGMKPGECYKKEGKLLLFRGDRDSFDKEIFAEEKDLPFDVLSVEQLFDIFKNNGEAIARDFKKLTAGKESAKLSATNTVVGEPCFGDGTPKIFIEEGATVECAVINVKKGPVYIGRHAEIMEGSCIRAPFAACENAAVKMGAKIYGATTLGPYCKVGGELNNVVMFGYSNKAHDGFLGDAVIGEWCNLGAGATASNLKNDYAEIKLWNYSTQRFLRTGLQFCGLIMGDHSKAGVNTMFNTATVLGVGVNVYGSGFPRNFIPSFSEGGTSGFSDVSLNKFFIVADRMMSRRDKHLNEDDKAIFEAIYLQAENYK